MILDRNGSLGLVILLLLTAALYGAVLSNGFVWDDFTLFIESPNLRVGDIAWNVLSRPVLDGTTYFRPLVLLSFALEFRTWGVNAAAAHAVNLSFHLLNTALVFAFCRGLFFRLDFSALNRRALAAASLYAVHPALTEPTVWVSGRFDLMVTSFVLLAVLADLYLRSQGWRLLALSLGFALALGCKENAVALPLILLFLRMIWGRPEHGPLFAELFRVLRQEWRAVVLLGLVFLIYVALRVTAFDKVIHEYASLARAVDTPHLHALLVLNTLFFYLREVLIPFAHFSPYHPLEISALVTISGWLKAATALACLGLVVRLAWARHSGAWLLSCFLVALLPVLHVVPLTIGGNIGHDRFLALPLVFAVAAVAMLRPLPEHWIKRRVQIALCGLCFGAWILMAAASVHVTVPLWRNSITLWHWIYERHPDFGPARTQYLSALMRYEKFDLAAPVFERLRAQGPLDVAPQLLYGAYLIGTGQPEEGENYIRGAMVALPRRADGGGPAVDHRGGEDSADVYWGYAYMQLAEAAVLRAQFDEALAHADRALQFAPHTPPYLTKKGLILMAIGRVEEGEAVFAEGLSLAVAQHRTLALKQRREFLNRLCSAADAAERRVCEVVE